MSYKDNETNKGKSWSTEEKSDLLKELMSKIPMCEISINHKRSIKSIECQGLNFAVELLEDKTMDEVIDLLGFTGHKIEEWLEEKKKKKKQSDNRKNERDRRKKDKEKYNNEILYDMIIELTNKVDMLKLRIEEMKSSPEPDNIK